MVSYVTELCKLFNIYAEHMLGSVLNPYIKNNTSATTPLNKKLIIVGDYPDLSITAAISNIDKPLCAVISLYEAPTISTLAQFGIPSTFDRTNISMVLWTGDPVLREAVHVKLSNFLLKNINLFTNTPDSSTHWILNMVQSGGFGKDENSTLYLRHYTLQIKSLYITSSPYTE